MVEPLRHRQTKEADNRYVRPTATAPHLDFTKPAPGGLQLDDEFELRGNPSGVRALMNPTTGMAGCCARATPAPAAPPSSVMNSPRSGTLGNEHCEG